MEVYEFRYCDCIYEGGYVTVSLHKTKAGAYKAMRKYKLDKYIEWYDSRIKWGKFGCYHPSDYYHNADIKTTKILD